MQIYVSSDCFSCEEAILMASEIARKFSHLLTEVVNLDDPGAHRPENVFAVPTYVLDGKVLSLGNPHREHLFASITAALGDAPPD